MWLARLAGGAHRHRHGRRPESCGCPSCCAVVHVDDRYGVRAASGVWIGLSSALRDGVFYPPVYDNGFYGGTRYMPLPAFLEAARPRSPMSCWYPRSC